MPDFPPPPPSEGDFPPLPPDDAPVPAPTTSRTGKTWLPRALVFFAIIGAVIYGASLIYRSAAEGTTLTYGFSLDGNEIPRLKRPDVHVDDHYFESGDHVKPGRHKLSVSVPENVEPYEQNVWVFYGTKELGNLPLETSKGSLSVTTSPSPATVIVRRGREDLTSGSSPFKLDKLSVGIYTLVVKRGDYEETRHIAVQRHQMAATNVSLNLGSVHLSADPADADFELTGNGRRWQGNLPTNIEDVPAGHYVAGCPERQRSD